MKPWEDFTTSMIEPKQSLNFPNREGVWLHVPTGKKIEIYALEPVGGTLCLWGPDIGITYTGAADTQFPWDDDEWQGHIPAHIYDDVGPWEFVDELGIELLGKAAE